MKETAETHFEALNIPRREVQNLAESWYRVYKDARNWELVEAASALEALQLSGVKTAYKIERHNPLADNVLQMATVHALLSGQRVEMPIVASVVPIETPVETAVEIAASDDREVVDIAPTKPAVETMLDNAEKSLSNEEVEKLLNG